VLHYLGCRTGQNLHQLLGDPLEPLLELDNIVAVFFVDLPSGGVEVVPQGLKAKRIAVLNQLVNFRFMSVKVSNDLV
jgi:hypothetical protein